MAAPVELADLPSLLATLPAPAVTQKPERPCYIVLGKPGVGRTTVATKLASSVNARLVSPEAVLREIVENEGRPEHAEILSCLTKGEEVSTEKILELLSKVIGEQETLFRGYVLDGIPSGLTHTTSKTSSTPDIDLLSKNLSAKQPYFTPYLVDLKLSDDDLIRRRAGQWADPETGILYPGAQVVFSRKQRADGRGGEEGDDESGEHGDGDEGDEDKSQKEDDEEVDDDAGSEDDEGSEASGEEAEEKKRKKRPVKNTDPPLTNKVEWPLISMEILDRLVKRPEDSPANVRQQLVAYPSDALAALRAAEFRNAASHRVVTLDASQHPDVLVPSLLSRLDALAVGTRVVAPRALAPPSNADPPKNLVDAERWYAVSDLAEGEPNREIGPWRDYDPVAGAKGIFTKVEKFDLCVCYKSSPENHALFQSNPLPYLLADPRAPHMTISVVGGPVSGKTTLTKMLEACYGLMRVSLDEVLERWDVDNIYKDEFPEVRGSCTRGQDVPAETAAALVKAVLRHAKDTGKQTARGWVLDGFPASPEQAQAMRAVGLVPSYTVRLDNDVTESKIRSRHNVNETFFDARHAAYHDTIAETLHILQAKDATPSAGVDNEATSLDSAMTAGTTVITVDATLRPTVALGIVQSAADPFCDKAEALTHKQLAALPSAIPFGSTKDYCPVALYDYGVLIKGDNAHVALYQSRYYYFSSSEAQSRFVASPSVYGRAVRIPPPRIILAGAPGTGKRVLADQLCMGGSMKHVRWEQLVAEEKERVKAERLSRTRTAENDNDDEQDDADEEHVSPEMVVKIFQNLINSEVYSSGYVLSGFPTRKIDVEKMIAAHCHPDVVAHITADPGTALVRVANVLRRAGKLTMRLREDADPEDPSPDGEDLEEDLDAVAESIEKAAGDVADAVGIMESKSGVPVVQIDANAAVRPVLSSLRKALASYLTDRQSLFSTAYKVTPKEATRSLELGVKSLSAFRRYCPVTLKATRYLTKQSVGTLPAVCGDYIYFLRDNAARKTFLADPYTYTSQQAPPPVVRPKISIIGGPKAGATTMAVALAEQLDAVYLDIPLAIQSILDGREIATGLYEELKVTLDSGGTVPDEMVARAVACVTGRALCQEKGWILDGWPFTKDQAKHLEALDVQPQLMIELTISAEERDRRAASDQAKNAKYVAFCAPAIKYALSDDSSFELLSQGTPDVSIPGLQRLRAAAYDDRVHGCREVYQQKYGNWTNVDGTLSKWAAKSALKKLIAGSIERRQEYLGAVFADTAAPIFDVGTDLQHVDQNMGQFGDYCPVCLTDRNELVKGEPGTNLMAEYQGAYYRLAGPEELRSFRADPAKYVEHGRKLPSSLPLQRSSADFRAMFPKKLELQGYCPVTFAQGPKDFASIVSGSPDYIAEYEDKLYSMADADKLATFMRTPWRFASLKLPHKLPPRPAPISVATLPLIGYLEQTVATKITEGLLAVGRAKPKYPYKTIEGSAVEYLALYLKANNPKSKDWTRSAYASRLKQYQERCELIGYLHGAAGMSTEAERPRFIAPNKREPGFDKRMGEFLELGPLRPRGLDV
ncbi:adenylate kinase [Geranomyces michiganensis]|nr:adenylate kinase [Geranomyces michiganensis]